MQLQVEFLGCEQRASNPREYNHPGGDSISDFQTYPHTSEDFLKCPSYINSRVTIYIYRLCVCACVYIIYIYFSLSLSLSVLEFPPPSLPKDVYSLLAVDPPVSWRCGSYNSPFSPAPSRRVQLFLHTLQFHKNKSLVGTFTVVSCKRLSFFASTSSHHSESFPYFKGHHDPVKR